MKVTPAVKGIFSSFTEFWDEESYCERSRAVCAKEFTRR